MNETFNERYRHMRTKVQYGLPLQLLPYTDRTTIRARMAKNDKELIHTCRSYIILFGQHTKSFYFDPIDVLIKVYCNNIDTPFVSFKQKGIIHVHNNSYSVNR